MGTHDDPSSTDPSEIEALIARLHSGQLRDADARFIERLLRLLLKLINIVEHKNVSISRLKRLLFGSSTDTRSAPPTKPPAQQQDAAAGSTPSSSEQTTLLAEGTSGASGPNKQTRRPGHGRFSADAYTGAAVAQCFDPQLTAGAACPHSLCSGHLYDTKAPAIFIRLTGQPIVGATRFEQQILRCSTCQTRFTAPLPEGISPQKFDPSADVAIALAKYAAGLPFYRLSGLQRACGVPLPASVLFERCEAVADAVLPVFLHLRRLAAQAQVLYADDTRVKILSCLKENKSLTESERRGLQTTGIVARVSGHQIALYISGRRHAGENMAELLRLRAEALGPPIQMGDAISSNWSHEFKTIVAKCLAHARRQFIEIEVAFPTECNVVLDALGEVYGYEEQTKGMTPEERLLFHQHQSGPVMSSLREWIAEQLAERQVEPNSNLGQALRYMQRHWDGLTKFLTTANAPLDNNVCERALKLAVLHRKNALFYKTEHGAAVGDLLMSLVETCRLSSTSPWEYLLAVMRQAGAVRRAPGDWLPWNFQDVGSQRQAA